MWTVPPFILKPNSRPQSRGILDIMADVTEEQISMTRKVAARRIEHDGWLQLGCGNRDAGWGLRGAIDYAAGVRNGNGHTVEFAFEGDYAERRAVANETSAAVMADIADPNGRDLIEWNDQSGRTITEVVAALRGANPDS